MGRGTFNDSVRSQWPEAYKNSSIIKSLRGISMLGPAPVAGATIDSGSIFGAPMSLRLAAGAVRLKSILGKLQSSLEL